MSSYQVEGAAYLRDPSIWDDYAHTEGRIHDGTTGDIACDFYHRYKEDVALAKELGISDFRFSFSWPRLVDKEGNVKEDGLLFYKALIEEIRRNGMNPIVTIYHWDLPSYLQNRGGWISRGILKDFSRYIDVICEHFAGDIDTWLTFNEPQCFICLGYTDKNHAPGIKVSYHDLLVASHHVLLAHSIAYKKLKSANPLCQVSFVNAFTPPLSAKDDPLAEEKLKEKQFALPRGTEDFYPLSLYADPLFLGHYPEGLKEKDDCSFILEGDMEAIKEARPDFMAVNIYTASYWDLDEEGELKEVPSPYSPEEEKSDLMWLNKRPKSLYYGVKRCYERYGVPIFVTENGACYKDGLTDGMIHDEKRSQFIIEYLTELDKLVKEGYPVLGYYYWSLLDNFEWSDGLSKRFGLIYVDFDGDLKRYCKDSFFTFQKIILSSKSEK